MTTQPPTTVIALTETLRIAQAISKRQHELCAIEAALDTLMGMETSAKVLEARAAYLDTHITYDQDRLFDSVLEQCGDDDITRWLLRDLNAEEGLNDAQTVEVTLTKADDASLHRVDTDGAVIFYGTHPLLGLPEEEAHD